MVQLFFIDDGAPLAYPRHYRGVYMGVEHIQKVRESIVRPGVYQHMWDMYREMWGMGNRTFRFEPVKIVSRGECQQGFAD